MILVLGQSNGRGVDEPTTASILAEKRAIVESGEIERMGMAGIVASLASLALRAQVKRHDVNHTDGWPRALQRARFTWLPQAVTMPQAGLLCRQKSHRHNHHCNH